LHDSYLRDFKKWDGELSDSVPRKARLKLAVLFLLFLLLLFIGLFLYGTVYFVATALLQKNDFPMGAVTLILVFLVIILFIYFGKAERRSVQSWKKIKGTIDTISHGRFGRMRISYEFGGEIFSDEKGEGRSEMRAENGDPIILLVNPEDPGSYLSYADLSWRAWK
jgi:hypothetical protein